MCVGPNIFHLENRQMSYTPLLSVHGSLTRGKRFRSNDGRELAKASEPPPPPPPGSVAETGGALFVSRDDEIANSSCIEVQLWLRRLPLHGTYLAAAGGVLDLQRRCEVEASQSREIAKRGRKGRGKKQLLGPVSGGVHRRTRVLFNQASEDHVRCTEVCRDGREQVGMYLVILISLPPLITSGREPWETFRSSVSLWAGYR